MPEWSCWNCLALGSAARVRARPLVVLCSVLVRSAGRRRFFLTLSCTQVHHSVPSPRLRWHTSGDPLPLSSAVWQLRAAAWSDHGSSKNSRRPPPRTLERLPPVIGSSDMAEDILITFHLLCCHDNRIENKWQKVRMNAKEGYEIFLKIIA